jgi:thiamine biosynthesis lipoprotein
MGGVNEVQLFTKTKDEAESVFVAIAEEVRRIEGKFSRFRKDSVIQQINNGAGKVAVEVDDETAKLLNFADATYHDSKGYFDITSGILQSGWDFSTPKLPEPELIARLQAKVGWSKVEWCPPAVRLTEEGMSIDFGGIGKEYAVDQAAEIALVRGITSGFINFAGDIRVLGPRPDGTSWGVGIVDPRETSTPIKTLLLQRGAVATSGDYERYVEVEGKRYCHILDPFTGYPHHDVWSVSVIADSCLVAGALSTSAMLLGYERGGALLRRAKAPYIMIGETGTVMHLDLAQGKKRLPYLVELSSEEEDGR